jgi:hypothetical protein
MKQQRTADKLARARAQLYQEAIENFIHADTPDPRAQAEERRIMQRLRAHAERWSQRAK